MTKLTENKITATKKGQPVRQQITLTNENGSSTGVYELVNGRTVLTQVDYKEKQRR